MKKDTDDLVEKLYWYPVWCEKCNQQGFLIEEDRRAEAFIVCPKCGWETSKVCYLKCHKSGNFIENIETRPQYWICPKCNKNRYLEDSFYKYPVSIYYEEDITAGKKIQVIPRFAKSPVEKLFENIYIGIGLVSFMVVDYFRYTHTEFKYFLIAFPIILILLLLPIGIQAFIKKRMHH